jgi:hypothetical protein
MLASPNKPTARPLPLRLTSLNAGTENQARTGYFPARLNLKKYEK